jgi:hypothetical protein
LVTNDDAIVAMPVFLTIFCIFDWVEDEKRSLILGSHTVVHEEKTASDCTRARTVWVPLSPTTLRVHVAAIAGCDGDVYDPEFRPVWN